MENLSRIKVSLAYAGNTGVWLAFFQYTAFFLFISKLFFLLILGDRAIFEIFTRCSILPCKNVNYCTYVSCFHIFLRFISKF